MNNCDKTLANGSGIKAKCYVIGNTLGSSLMLLTRSQKKLVL